MKKFIMIFRDAENTWANYSPQQWQDEMANWITWIGDLQAQGKLIPGGAQLMPKGASVVRGPQIMVTDGPYAEAKEVIGGTLLMLAANLAEATEIAKGCPGLAFAGSSVEVREVVVNPAPAA